ncbi:MAG: hypothetical protein HYY44_07720 [Deltaproteobacteria bacterium]|nr:hypothetical protein [Deltaproteobacteria bacterium]MBI4373625.1 hypothetical protein [Deltaproteobacteria bacterium]
MAGISDVAKGKLVSGDRTAFDLSKVACQTQSEEGPAFDAEGKPIPDLHHAKQEAVSCQYIGPAPNARIRLRLREKGPPVEQQQLLLGYHWQRLTRYPKSGESRSEAPEVVLTMRSLMEFSGKWYCLEVMDAGADGLLNGPKDAVVVSEYVMEKGGGELAQSERDPLHLRSGGPLWRVEEDSSGCCEHTGRPCLGAGYIAREKNRRGT